MNSATETNQMQNTVYCMEPAAERNFSYISARGGGPPRQPHRRRSLTMFEMTDTRCGKPSGPKCPSSAHDAPKKPSRRGSLLVTECHAEDVAPAKKTRSMPEISTARNEEPCGHESFPPRFIMIPSDCSPVQHITARPIYDYTAPMPILEGLFADKPSKPLSPKEFRQMKSLVLPPRLPYRQASVKHLVEDSNKKVHRSCPSLIH